ncbi:MAG: FGGY family carbohydrate kinase [Candidatus Melainabacteria bacterium]|jgi:glycerol kinase
MKKYLLAIDQGTTSCRSIIFNLQGDVIFTAQEKLGQNYPQAGWVEQDLEILWQTQLQTIKACLTQVAPAEILSIGITNQRETIGLWDKQGKPLTPAISWQCNRTKDSLEYITSAELQDQVRKITGLPINPYFSASKLNWLIKNSSVDLQNKIKNGEVLAGTIDSWLLFKLTGNQNHFTDLSNASRTLLLDIRTGNWSDELLKIFEIPKEILPQLKPCQSNFGLTSKEILGCEIMIGAMIGDQQAALYGHGCLEPGMAELTCGTGGFLLSNIGANCGQDLNLKEGLLTSIAWQLQKDDIEELTCLSKEKGIPKQSNSSTPTPLKGDSRIEHESPRSSALGDCKAQNREIIYTQEASILSMGSMIEWLARLGIIDKTSDLDELINEAKDIDDLQIMPTITGFGSPYWSLNQKAEMHGLSAGIGSGEILRATMKALAFRVKQVTSSSIHELRIGGGLSKSNFFCQYLADLLGIAIKRSQNTEATAWGAAIMSHHEFKQEDLLSVWKAEKDFMPNIEKSQSARAAYEKWLDRFF